MKQTSRTNQGNSVNTNGKVTWGSVNFSVCNVYQREKSITQITRNSQNTYTIVWQREHTIPKITRNLVNHAKHRINEKT